MATYNDIAVEACGYIDRQDLLARANTYVRDVVRLICGKVPFEELRDTHTASLADGTASVALPATLSGIIYVRVENSTTGLARRLRKTDMRVLDNLPVVSFRVKSMPSQYAREGNNIILNPVSDGVYSLKVKFWKKHPEDGTIGNTIVLLPEAWHELIRYEALFRLYMHTGELDKAQLMRSPGYPRQFGPRKQRVNDMGILPLLWNDLLLTVDQREAVDDNFGLRPRSY